MCANAGGGDIVHAGTFFGDFLPALSRAVEPARTVWAFEPSLESFRCATITIALNDLANIELTRAALGPKSGNLSLRTIDDEGRKLGGASHFDPAEGTEMAPQVRLDDVVPADRAVSIIQLDVEGYEGQALKGCRETIRRNRPIIILETVPPEFAESQNYVFIHRLADNYVFRPA
jgi:FkbM family methyltransferase